MEKLDVPAGMRRVKEPAFPSNNEAYLGMSLRDYFAAAAMQGLIEATGGGAVDLTVQVAEGILHLRPLAGIPSLAFQYADAMLAERAK